jgi:hypothetical protein
MYCSINITEKLFHPPVPFSPTQNLILINEGSSRQGYYSMWTGKDSGERGSSVFKV